MRKFIKKLVFVLVPMFVLLLFVNYFGDAAHLFNDTYNNQLSKYLLGGFNVTNVQNYNERILQKKIIASFPNVPETVVLGSSRLMLVNSGYYPEQSFFNNSVTGASLQDIVVIVGMFDAKGVFPKKMIIGFDPWTLNANNGSLRYKSLMSDYKFFSNKITHSPKETETGFVKKIKLFVAERSYFKELLSPSYFNGSLLNLISHDQKPIATKNKTAVNLTKLADGSITYDSIYRNASPTAINDKVEKYIEDQLYGIENFKELDSKLITKLEALVGYLKNKNVQVEFLLVPYHPKVHKFILRNEKYKKVMEAERYIKEYGIKNKILIKGSFDPSQIKASTIDFFDGMHMNEKGINKLMEKEKNDSI